MFKPKTYKWQFFSVCAIYIRVKNDGKHVHQPIGV